MISFISLLATVSSIAQNNENQVSHAKPNDLEPLSSNLTGEILLPVMFISFLVFMLISLIKHFLEFRLKNKLIDRGMSEQLSAYILTKNDQEKQNELIKLAILFCGIGIGLTMIYLTGPIHIHSLAIMSFSLGLSYLAYYFYLRRKNT